MIVNITMVARQILMLPVMTEVVDYSSTTANPPTASFNMTGLLPVMTEAVDYSSITANPPTASFNMTGLVTGLIVAIVVVLLFLITLGGIMVIFCKFHQTRR